MPLLTAKSQTVAWRSVSSPTPSRRWSPFRIETSRYARRNAASATCFFWKGKRTRGIDNELVEDPVKGLLHGVRDHGSGWGELDDVAKMRAQLLEPCLGEHPLRREQLLGSSLEPVDIPPDPSEKAPGAVQRSAPVQASGALRVLDLSELPLGRLLAAGDGPDVDELAPCRVGYEADERIHDPHGCPFLLRPEGCSAA